MSASRTPTAAGTLAARASRSFGSSAPGRAIVAQSAMAAAVARTVAARPQPGIEPASSRSAATTTSATAAMATGQLRKTSVRAAPAAKPVPVTL